MTIATEVNLEYALYKNFVCVVPNGKDYHDLSSVETAAVRAVIGEKSESICENVWRAADLSKLPTAGFKAQSERAQKLLNYLKDEGTLDDDGVDAYDTGDLGFQEEVRQALFSFPLEDCDDRTEEGLLLKVKELVRAWQAANYNAKKKKKF